VGGRASLVLPGVSPLLAAAGVQVMDEQYGHGRLAGGGFEDLDAERYVAAYAASARFSVTERVRVGGATFSDGCGSSEVTLSAGFSVARIPVSGSPVSVRV
jgi:hypothetical protein